MKLEDAYKMFDKAIKLNPTAKKSFNLLDRYKWWFREIKVRQTNLNFDIK